MNPVYNEYIKFLRDTSGEELPCLKEGFFWLDKQIIKGFDSQLVEHKFYRVKVSDNLEKVEILKLKSYEDPSEVDLIDWRTMVNIKENHLREIEHESLCLIREKIENYDAYTPIIPVSMGKDSMVTCHLVRQLYPNTKAIFNNTSLDCADTYRMVKTFPNCEIFTPEEGFYPWQKRVNWIPSRTRRGCCSIFKVGAMIDNIDKNENILLFMGMRNQESNTRSGYGDEIINPELGKTNWQGILPIREWSEIDVWLYIMWKNIEINPKYKKGYSRVGCAIACPFYGKSTWILDKYWYPTMRKRWENILTKYFINNKGWITFNCTLQEYLTQAWNGGIFRDEPTQKVIDEFVKYTGIDKQIALQYFNKKCCCCDKRIKHKEVLSMNLKVNGRQVNKFYCKKCLMKEFDWNKEDWDKQVALFKTQGCALF